MASSRKKGTNEHISTYGNATRDYTSLATWEADTDNDLVTLAQSEVLECYDDAASFNDYVTLDGAITNASYFRIIRPAAGQGHDGTPNNGFTINNTTDIAAIILKENNSQIQDLIVFNTIDSSTTRNACSLQTTGAFIGCIAKSTNATASGGRGFGVSTAGGGFLINCLAYKCKSMGIDFGAVAGQTMNAYCCTAYGNGDTGFNIRNAVAGTINLISCLSTANTIKDFSAAATPTKIVIYCASGDDTADDWGGSGNRINQTFTFANTAIDDYHLAPNDAGARNYGYPFETFNDDINDGIMGAGKAGQTRPGESAWDIGFDEFVEPMPDRWHPSIEQPYSEKIEVIGY
jgi:hypothetical protein